MAGGKGANLARLAGAGKRVPPGFAVTTRSYTEATAAIDLEPMLAVLDDGADAVDPLCQ